MQEHFLRNIEIIDFKCFKNFKAKDFKRVNLISGKNNVGKTAFMESLYINLHNKDVPELTFALDQISYSRDNLEFIGNKKLLDNQKMRIEKNEIYYSISNKNSIKFEIIEHNAIKEYHFNINNKETIVNINNFSYNTVMSANVLHIDNFGLTNDNLIYVYESIQENDKELELNFLINKFDSNISSFKIIGNNPKCKSLDSEEYQDINEFGDGLKHYISIIAALYHCEDGQLFIDEIDNGIHYTLLEKLWEIIFTISKEVNCQVFATTHSKEMINAFAKVSQELKDEDISFIELGRNKDNEIKANVYDQEMFLYELNQNHEVRGW